MDYTRKTRLIANSYYNLGIERAAARDLTKAAECLKKSLHFNKYHVDARNLLGLIYYETGEVADALVQWVISTNFQPENNRADYYLDEIQRKKGSLESESQVIRRYNQALGHARSGSDDLAILQLGKVTSAKPGYIKAQLLSALLYLKREEYAKAGKAVSQVLKVDHANPGAMLYKSIIKGAPAPKSQKRSVSARPEPERRKGKNVLSHSQMLDDDIIIPPSYKEYTKDQAVFNILAGLVLGAAVIFFLVMPANTRAINARHNQELLSYSEQLSRNNQEIADLNEKLTGLEAEKQAAEDAVTAMSTDGGSLVNQYQTLIGILEAYRKGDFTEAVKLYAALDPSVITNSDVLAIIGEIKSDMETNGYQALEQLGDEAASAGDTQAALDYYMKSLGIKGDNWPVKYKAALIYKGMNEKDTANDMFTDIINNSRDEELTAQAKSERGF